MKVIRRRLGLCGCFAVNTIGKKGDLTILWKKEGQIDVPNYSQGHISTWIEYEYVTSKWLLTGIYSEPDAS